MDPDLGDLVSRVFTSGLMPLGLSGQRRSCMGRKKVEPGVDVILGRRRKQVWYCLVRDAEVEETSS